LSNAFESKSCAKESSTHFQTEKITTNKKFLKNNGNQSGFNETKAAV